MSGKLEYKFLKNMPSYDAYGQYYYNDDNLPDFFQGTGIETVDKSDDIYTVITDEGFANGTPAEPDWKPVSHVFVGNPTDIGNYYNESLLRYYEFGTNQYIKTSAPNLVHLSFELATIDSLYDIEYDNYYNGRTGTIGVKIVNWDWTEGDYDIINYSPNVDAEYINLYQADLTTPNYISHKSYCIF